MYFFFVETFHFVGVCVFYVVEVNFLKLLLYCQLIIFVYFIKVILLRNFWENILYDKLSLYTTPLCDKINSRVVIKILLFLENTYI